MDILDHPYKDWKSIHITGTNGKGSVALKTASVLSNSGFKVGLYTSPHLFSVRERIKINEQLIERDIFAEYVIKIDEICKRQNIILSYFEILTSAAFLHFKDQKCDYVSLEVGLGGRNDTTNIVNPQICVITSLGMDHMNVLGNTIEQIGYQKSGIFKQNIPVVLGTTSQIPTVIQIAEKLNCPIHKIPPFEDFQQENRQTSQQILKIVAEKNSFQISQKSMQQGLSKKQACRLEKLQPQYFPKYVQGKDIYFDVGHNVPAMEKVKKFFQINKKYGKQQISVIYGSSKGKDFFSILSVIEQFASFVYLIQAQHYRSETVSHLQNYIGSSKYPYKFRQIEHGNIAKTLQIVSLDPHCKCILVCGSFFLMPEAKGFFQPELISHPEQNINQMYQMKQDNQKREF